VSVRVQKRKPGAPPEFRDVVLGPRAIAILEAQRGFHDEYVFTYEARRRGTQQPTGARRPITASGVDMIFKRKRFRSRLSDFRFHDLRHTAGSRIVRATKDINLAKDRLGHSSIAVTAKFYAHVLPGDRLRAAEALEDNLAPRPLTQHTTPHEIPHKADAKTRYAKGGKV
jgi:integrase